ncbi:MAG TPA: hypothetical protein VLG28_16880 [Acidimicrobiia bacterium]|nr:hypothetical protein [Acidimicrobiia bacterium]
MGELIGTDSLDHRPSSLSHTRWCRQASRFNDTIGHLERGDDLEGSNGCFMAEVSGNGRQDSRIRRRTQGGSDYRKQLRASRNTCVCLGAGDALVADVDLMLCGTRTEHHSVQQRSVEALVAVRDSRRYKLELIAAQAAHRGGSPANADWHVQAIVGSHKRRLHRRHCRQRFAGQGRASNRNPGAALLQPRNLGHGNGAARLTNR